MSSGIPGYGYAFKGQQPANQPAQPQIRMTENPPVIESCEVLHLGARELLRITLSNVRGSNTEGRLNITIDPANIMAIQGPQPIWQLGGVSSDNTVEVCNAVTLWLKMGDAGNPLAFNIPISEDALMGLLKQAGILRDASVKLS